MNPRIAIDPKLFNGKPFIKGAGIPIHIILDFLSMGLSFDEIIVKYPKLTEQDISAAVEYALLKTRDELMKPTVKSALPDVEKESRQDQSPESKLPPRNPMEHKFPPRPPEPKFPPDQPTERKFPPRPSEPGLPPSTRLPEPKFPPDQPTERKFPPRPSEPGLPPSTRLPGFKAPSDRFLEPEPSSIPRREPDLRRPSTLSFQEDRLESQIEPSAWNKFVLTLDRIKTFLVLITKTVLTVLVLILLGSIVYFLLGQKRDITILPFENAVGLEVSQTMGEGLATHLISELERIQRLQSFPLEGGSSLVHTLLEERTAMQPPATEPLKVTFKKAESLKIGSVRVPFDSAIAALQKLGGGENKLLSGSIHKFGLSYSLTASLGKEKFFDVSEENLEVYPPASETESQEEKIHKLVRILAYKLAFTTLNASSLPPSMENGWKSYFYFSEGLGAYQRFLSNPKTRLKDWEEALNYFQKALTFHYSNPKTHFNLGLVHQMLVEQGISGAGSTNEHLNKAAEAYREALKLKPDFPDAYYQLATVYLAQKDYTHAASSLHKSIELKANVPDLLTFLLHLKLGEVYLLAGQYEEAKGVYQKILALGEKAPKSERNILTRKELETLAHYGLAKVYQASKDFEAAVQEYNQILTLNLHPSLITLAHRNIGQIYIQQGKYREAIFEYQEALRFNPEDEKSHLELSFVYTELRQYPEAVAELKEAIRINSNSAEVYRALGEVYLKQNKTLEAIQAYKQALQIRPEYPEALYALGLAYARQQANSEAIQQYQKVLQIDPKFPGVRTSLGLIYYRLGKYQEAISEFIQVLQENSEDKWAHLGIGLIHARQGRYPEAEAKYAEILRIDPDFAPAYNYLGQVYTLQKKFSEAVAKFEKALELSPGYAEAYANLGAAYAEMGHYEEALSELTKALKLNDALPEAHASLGKVYTKQGLISEALAAYQEALEINPNLVEAHLGLAKIYLQQSNYPKAIEEFKEALKFDSTLIEASQGLEQAERELSQGGTSASPPPGASSNPTPVQSSPFLQ